MKRYTGKKLRFPIVEDLNKGMFSDQSDVGAEMPNSSDGVYHLSRTEPKEIHPFYDRAFDKDSTSSEIKGAVGGSNVDTHPDKRVEAVKVRYVYSKIILLK